jgi:VIT1/CCC1 family predicted Fe2+/Mn2+ transporter
MGTYKTKSFLSGIPSWGLALLTMFLAFVVLMVVGDIMTAIVERNFWISSLWIVICSGWALSIIASIIGARRGRKVALYDNSEIR